MKSILALLALASVASAQQKAQFVRISLTGEGRTLSLAEVEVMSGGVNLARKGKATQSSVAHGGEASRAIDGNKSKHFNKNGITHTQDKSSNPWWEVDLGKVAAIDEIGIWNRGNGHGSRLDGFNISLLDSEKKEIFNRSGLDAPYKSVHIDFKKDAEISYYVKGGGRSVLKYVPADYKDPLPFKFEKEDRIAILGNGLADRMQHDGWTETLLQEQLKGKKVSFRNMSLSGDQFDRFPRSKGFTSMVQYVRQVRANVVFAMFGYNESHKMSAEQYEAGMNAFVKKARSWGEDGNFPRVVLFSPIPREDLKDPNLPSGEENNVKLKAFTEATRRAAEKSGVQFVDVYTPMLARYESSDAPLTVNGVHLNSAGNKALGEIVASTLFDKEIKASKSHDKLRAAVLKKADIWHRRYRALDGNDIWGSRSTIKYAKKQTNADVLKHELTQYDVMTENRDQNLWAVAEGKSYSIDDSNTPASKVVLTNRKHSLSPATEKGAKRRYLSAEESLKKMTLQDGLEAEVFADESRFPGLINPVQLQVDAKGRLWAAVWPTYPMARPENEVNDALLIFEDTDNDGKADSVKEFAKVHCPLGFEFWNGGVIVSTQPNIIFLKDTDGDDVADERIILLQGLGSSDTHHSANNLIMGPDGAIYWQCGIFLQHSYEHPYGAAFQPTTSGLYRFDPRTFEITLMSGLGSNPHGIAFDEWGYQYVTDGTSGNAFQIRVDGNRFKKFSLLDKEVRPVPASEVLSSQHFPEDMQQDFLICNAITYLGLKRYDLHRDGGKKSGYESGQVWGTPAPDFLYSKDRNFRPSDAIVGQDGSLFVSDWHNVLIGHMQHNVRDPQRDHRHGRIFRITAKGRDLEKPSKVHEASIEQLLDNLKHPTNGVRHRSRVELSARPTKDVIAAAAKWLAQFDPSKKEHARHLMEGLWLYQQHHQRNPELLAKLLESPEPHIKHAAARVDLLWNKRKDASGAAPKPDEKDKKIKKGGVEFDRPELLGFRVNALPEKMKFDVSNFSVKAGKMVQVTFVNPDHMPHNIVFVKPGTADSVAAAALALGAEGFKKQFVPKSEDVIASSKLIDHSQKQVFKFKAPMEKGDYQFVCTFPGHDKLMRGVMKVK